MFFISKLTIFLKQFLLHAFILLKVSPKSDSSEERSSETQLNTTTTNTPTTPLPITTSEAPAPMAPVRLAFSLQFQDMAWDTDLLNRGSDAAVALADDICNDVSYSYVRIFRLNKAKNAIGKVKIINME